MSEIVEEVHGYSVGSEDFEGFFAYPKGGPAKVPGILIFHEWKGHGDYVRRRARMFAQLGYLAFAADLYGKGKYAKDHEEALKFVMSFFSDQEQGTEKLKSSLLQLTGHARCDVTKVASVGYCFGGMVGLWLARTGVDIKLTAMFHSSLGVLPHTKEIYAAIPGTVVMFQGAIDPALPSTDIDKFEAAAKEANLDYIVVKFANTVHSFTVEGMNDPANGIVYNPLSDARSWSMLLALLQLKFH
mmetsp:Transcript_23020/g.39562  ORF Transcript_23020/g.39562 Transcript_23020/m.39562 type:complete len:243 (+) Transcript_23020:10-738(+)